MDILIKNMEMPKSCITGKIPDYEYCPFFGSCSKASAKTERPSDCPIVALPEHGRLISDTDVKALLRSGLSLDTDSDMDYACGLIDGLTTIVEATE